MNMPEFNPHEQQLIDQLRQSPAPHFDITKVSSLRDRIFAEVDVVWESPKTPDSNNGSSGKPWPWITGILMILAVVSLLLSGLSRMTREDAAPGETLPAPTEQMPETLIIPPTSTVTSTSTTTDARTATMTPLASSIEERTPTVAPTLTPADTAPALTTTSTATQALATPSISQEQPVIVIEGQISEMGERYIVIFDMWIELGDSSDSGFQIRPGITVRVEGMPRLEPDRMIIQAMNITIVQPGQSAGPTEQQVQPGAAPPAPSRPDNNRSSRSS